MADKTDKNGFEVEINQNPQEELQNADQAKPAVVQQYTKELMAEKLKLDSDLTHCQKLLDQEIERSHSQKNPQRDDKYVDVYNDKPVRLDVKVMIPIKEYPKLNFIGKLLGPKGNTMKKLKEETMCKISIFGKGSIKDKQKEEELRTSLDPKYAHFNEDLHVGISALAPPAEAYARMAFALEEVRKYLTPDLQDSIHPEKMHEMYGGQENPRRPPNPLQPPHFRAPPILNRGPLTGAPPRGPPPPRSAPGPRPRLGAGNKPSILSILDRARSAMEESYGFNESYSVPPPPPSSRHQLEEQYDDYYEEPAQGAPRDYYRTPAAITTDTNNYYNRNDYGGNQSSAPQRPSYGQARGGPGRHDNRQGFRTAPYQRPGK